MMAEFLQRVWETVWQMSLTGGFVCLAVCALRLLMKKAPKSYAYVLWAVVFFRFVCPVGLSGSYSIIPQWDAVGQSVQGWVQEQMSQGVDASHGDGNEDLLNNMGMQDPVAQDPAMQNPAVQDPAVQDPAVNDPAVRPNSSQSQDQQSGQNLEQNPGRDPQSGSQLSTGQNGTDPSDVQQGGIGQKDPASSGTAQDHVQQNGTTPSVGQSGGQGVGSVVEQEDMPQNSVAPVIPNEQAPDSERNISITAMIWLTGILVIAAVQWIRTRRWQRALGIVEIDQAGVYEISGLATPFVMGLCHPRIYLPVGMDPAQKQYVLLHEQTHIRRRDYLVKGVAFGIACLHWFNPLAWLAYYLMCMDMEMSCDESVLVQMEGNGRKAYAQALLTFAEQSAGGGLAFGEPYAMKRIRNVLQYRRPGFEWTVILTILCLAVSGCLLTDSHQTEGPEKGEDGEIIVIDRDDETEESNGKTEPSTEPLNPEGAQQEEPLLKVSKEMLERLNTYPQASQEELDYFNRFLTEPYHLAFVSEEYTYPTEEILWQVAAALADQLGPESEISQEELGQLKSAGMDMYLDLIWVSTEDILQAWERCTETTLTKADLREHLTGWYYLSQTDRWYLETGGVMAESVVCVNVQKHGALTQVIYRAEYSDYWGEVLLQGNEVDGYTFFANKLYYTENYEVLYAPEGFYEAAVKYMADSQENWYNGLLAGDRSLWFEEHNGGALQVVNGVYDTDTVQPDSVMDYWYDSPMYCNDIVYYRPSGEESIDAIAATMMEAMVDRMTKPSEVRPFTITQYRIVEKEVNSVEVTLRELWNEYRLQTITNDKMTEDWDAYLKEAVIYDGRVPIDENTWYFIPQGYYAFEGVGMLGATMEDEITVWPEGYQDGMIPFQAQGSDGVFVFVLMKEGDVYRLQRVDGMVKSKAKLLEEAQEQETFSEDEYYAQVDAYWDSFQVGSTTPQITDKSVSWYADLNHDGTDERILFDWGYMTPGNFAVFAVLDSDGEVLYVTDPAVAHAGWMTYYLCEMDGQEYLLSYSPYEGTGGADYGFQLLEWNGKNETVTVDQGYVFFRVGDGEYFAKHGPEWYMDIPAMVEFAVDVNQYLEHSTLLFSTDEGWLGEAIEGSRTGMFVLGSVDRPYRQYENYCGTGRGRRDTEKNPTAQELQDILVARCERLDIPYTLNGFDVLNRPQPLSEDEWFTLWQQQLETYQLGSMDPQISYKSESWYADLDHDGVNERIVFDRYFWDSISRGIFAVLESNGQVVYVDNWLDTSHAGWATYYVCQRDGKEYLLWYAPHVSTGLGEYQYKLLELSASGELQVAEQDETFFEANSVQYVLDARPNYKMDIGDMAAFAENVNALLDTSYLLVSTDQDWMSWDLSQTENGFVLGYRGSSRQQYENFRARTGKVRATVRPEQGEIYEQLKMWCEAEGMPYINADSSTVWYADLTHDGQQEKIVFDWSQFDAGGVGTFSVRDRWDSEFYSAEISSNHGSSSTYYLCQWQGQDCLFYYKPYIMMGEGYNHYELFYLTATGEKVVVDSGEVRFHVDFVPSIVNEYGKKVMDIPAMVRFAETVNRYVASSYLLVCSDSEWLPMPYSEDRYFVAGSPEEPYRVSETYACFDRDEKEVGQDLSSIADVAQKLKIWCEWAKMPYAE